MSNFNGFEVGDTVRVKHGLCEGQLAVIMTVTNSLVRVMNLTGRVLHIHNGDAVENLALTKRRESRKYLIFEKKV